MHFYLCTVYLIRHAELCISCIFSSNYVKLTFHAALLEEETKLFPPF